MKVLKDYGNHHSIDEWEKSELYCPNCGKMEVWICRDGGDYYQGETHVCSDCGLVFHMPGFDLKPDATYQSVAEQLKTGMMKSPKAKRQLGQDDK